jgi:hypothetical protein
MRDKKGAWQGLIAKFDNLDEIIQEVESSLVEANALMSS